MTDQLISYTTAVLAKAKGFDAETLWSVSDSYKLPLRAIGGWGDGENHNADEFKYSCPTQSLLAHWLREKHWLHVNAQHNMHYCWQVQVQDVKGYDGTERVFDTKWLMHDYNTYEDALEAGLAHALNQIK